MTTDDQMLSGMTDQTLARVLRDRAEAWNYSAELEKAAELSASGGQLSPNTRMSLSFYENGKRAAAALGRDVSDPFNSRGADRIAAAYDNLKGN
ncbi:hypothetical protein [Streptomyces sp. NPDC005784]|uniref:hypothetical protein n=1 Tax=Streptomyces sp. NPDC005784 TaxID=3364731 RepID=UPI0036940DB7